VLGRAAHVKEQGFSARILWHCLGTEMGGSLYAACARAHFHVVCTCVHAYVHFHIVSNRLFVSPEKKEKEIRM